MCKARKLKGCPLHRQATDETAALKPKTTVAFDFGRLSFGPEMAVHLYGTPGQSRFDFMWDILIQKAHAYILLVTAHRPSEFIDARRIRAFMCHRSQAPMIIGLTHTDSPDAWDLENAAIALGYLSANRRPPIVAVHPTASASVAQAVMTLVQHSLQGCLV
ncbi:ATP/GTP-binding protein [Stenomitos frigidus]|uniref:ATP/GTP-binding protein n=1 Tax=Stenomitos frigidus TaxID=1886765 RepID=UPI0011B27E68